MSENVPVFDSGVSYTRQTTADVAGGLLVEVSGPGTVAASAATSKKWLGTVGFDAKNGESVTVYIGGVQRCTASGAVTAGDVVVAAANGRVVTNAAPGAGEQVGVALTSASDGATVEIQMAR